MTAAALVLVSLALADPAGAAPAAKPVSRLGALPATFSGLLPCADCSGIRYQIDLLPRAAFVQRMTYLRNGHNQTHDEFGTWTLSADSARLVLDGGPDGVTTWAVMDTNKLRKLDVHGHPIDSKLPYELKRSSTLSPIEPNGVQPALAHTRWRPTSIGARAVSVSGQEREPWLVLDPRARRVTGSGGCNRFSGGYEAGDGTLEFGPLVGTRMACLGMETENAFLETLGSTRRFRLFGRHLDLLDARGAVLARLEERNLK